ncbi:MAG TPA: saccharopine dehydrogenase NADP-binding domain-containing protein [Actinomycetaceae bacterium]|nr:saccharopine dehydrogenase NADP-binding domain-containing protein [Actinomycetaceae bacterium]
MRIVMLGGSGNAGRAIAGLLGPRLNEDDVLILAGRDPGRLTAARAAAAGRAQVQIATLDVTQLDDVRQLLEASELVIVAVSRPDLIGGLARAVLESGADWFDTLLSTPEKLASLRALAPDIEAAGQCFVTDGGFHPGVPAALVRWAADQFGELHEADVFAGMRLDWLADTLSDSTITEFLDEFSNFDGVAWIDGERRKVRSREYPRIDFGPPIGRKLCVPMPLTEMDSLPDSYPTLHRTGFYISGTAPVFDYLATPALIGVTRVLGPRPATLRFARRALRLGSQPPPHRLVIKLRARGLKDGHPAEVRARISGDDGYHVTAAPAVSCIRQMLGDSRLPPGLHFQAHFVPPGEFLDDLQSLGLEVETTAPPGAESHG